MSLVLVDQDNVLAHFDAGVMQGMLRISPAWRLRFPPRKNFYIKRDFSEKDQPLVESVYNSQGFYLNLPIVPGAVDGINELVAKGHRVQICTSPLESNPYCREEKVEWVRRNLGSDWVGLMIITSDKVSVPGNFLIDDKPDLNCGGASWEHLLFDQPYNRFVTGRRRVNWRNLWKVVPELSRS